MSACVPFVTTEDAARAKQGMNGTLFLINHISSTAIGDEKGLSKL